MLLFSTSSFWVRDFVVSSIQPQRTVVQNQIFSWRSVLLFDYDIGNSLNQMVCQLDLVMKVESVLSSALALLLWAVAPSGNWQHLFLPLFPGWGKRKVERGRAAHHSNTLRGPGKLIPPSLPYLVLRMAILWLQSHISLQYLVHKGDYFFSLCYILGCGVCWWPKVWTWNVILVRNLYLFITCF